MKYFVLASVLWSAGLGTGQLPEKPWVYGRAFDRSYGNSGAILVAASDA